MQGIERIADLVRDAGGQKRQRLDALAFDGFERLLPRFGCIVQNQGHTGASRRFAIERRGVKKQEPVTRIMDLEFLPHQALPAPGVQLQDVSSIPARAGNRRWAGLDSRLQPSNRVTA